MMTKILFLPLFLLFFSLSSRAADQKNDAVGHSPLLSANDEKIRSKLTQPTTEIDEELISFFTSNRHHHWQKVVPMYFYRDDLPYRQTVIMGDSCADLLPFAGRFIKWSKTLSKGTNFPQPKCVCDQGVCAIELTKYFPECFRDKIKTPINCNGPNCYNATLIARGFLQGHQMRFSSDDELGFYLNQYCRRVPISKRKTNDIVAFFNSPDERISHCGLYIDRDILFTKGGPSKTTSFAFQDCTEKFKASKSIVVFRCNRLPTPQSIPALSRVETAYSQILYGELPQTELAQKLLEIEQEISKIDEFSLSERVFWAFDSLRSSLFTSRHKQLVLIGENNLRILSSINCLKSIKRPSDPSNSLIPIEDVKVGDFVLVNYESQHKFLPGKYYKVSDIL